jgi:alpha-L-fucosidase 2
MTGHPPPSIIATFLCAALATAAEPLATLWYQTPADSWQTSALPIGNGSLGAMIFGGTAKDRIQFNHDTLWIGGETNTGAYQAFGELFIELGHENPTTYRRELDISRAVHTTTYTHGGTQYTREAFASKPAGVIVIRLTANAPEAHTGSITLTDHARGLASVVGAADTACALTGPISRCAASALPTRSKAKA